MPNAILVRHGRDGPVCCIEEGEICPVCKYQCARAWTKAEMKAQLDHPDCPPDFKIGGKTRDELRASPKAFEDAWRSGTSWTKAQVKAWLIAKGTAIHAGEPASEIVRRWVE